MNFVVNVWMFFSGMHTGKSDWQLSECMLFAKILLIIRR